jgi:hypothetical protein
MPCKRRQKRVRVGEIADHIKHLELIDFLHVLFDFVFEAADAGAGGASMSMPTCQRQCGAAAR